MNLLLNRASRWADVDSHIPYQGRVDLAGRYLQAGQLQAGDTVTVSFPIAETTKLLEVEKHVYNVTIRGADVVNVDPAGELGPLYQRDHYRRGQTLCRKASRFVPHNDVRW